MLYTINIILVLVLVFINTQVLYKIVKGKILSFQPYALFSLTVIAQLFPQLYVIFNNSYYSKAIIPNLLIMMISCQLAFKYGYNRGVRKPVKGEILDFNERNIKWLLFVFAIAGVIPMTYYASMQSVYGGINVVLGQLRTMGVMALIISLYLLFIKQDRSKKFLWIIAILAFIPLFYYGYFVKGSRQTLFSLFYIIIFFILYFKPKLENQLSLTFLVVFLVGNLLSASMTDIRRTNNYHEDSATSLGNIEYLENFKASFESPDLSRGMDLGNGAILIDYVYNNSTYDFGASIWNGFIYNYIPSRVLGDGFKSSLYMPTDYRTNKLEDKVKCGITYVTSYYNAFRIFSFGGFVIFFFIGYILGVFRAKSKYSSFYILSFIVCLIHMPNMLSGGLQFYFAPLELIFVLFMPIWAFYLRKKSISYVKI